MTKRFTVKQVLTEVGSPHLNLHHGEGYWYFIFDQPGKAYDSLSVCVPRLGHLSFDQWVETGRKFVEETKVA